jgi:hypothetical protein
MNIHLQPRVRNLLHRRWRQSRRYVTIGVSAAHCLYRHFFQRFEIVGREMMLNGIQRVRIAAIFQQLLLHRRWRQSRRYVTIGVSAAHYEERAMANPELLDFITHLEGLYRHFFQRFEIVGREMMLNGIQRVRIVTAVCDNRSICRTL